jgi:hypothetical protein
MFRLHCKGVNVPVALASGDEAKSAFDILVRWTDDLKADRVTLPAFGSQMTILPDPPAASILPSGDQAMACRPPT